MSCIDKMILKTPQVMKVEKFLFEKKMPIKLVKLDETARSAEEASRALKTQVGSIIKSLLFQVSFENLSLPVMALISGDKKGIEKKILEESGLKGKIKRPNADYVKHVTGFSIGGVSPLTISDDIPILIDENLNRFELLWASAGHTHWVFPIAFQDLVRLTKGKIVNNISKD